MRYNLRRGMARNIKTKILNISTSAVLVAVGLGGAVPIILASDAFAVAATTVTPVAMHGWTINDSSGAQIKFVPTAGAPLGTGAAELVTTSDNNSVAHLSSSANLPLKNLTTLTYEADQLSAGNPAIDGALRLSINFAGTGTSVDDQLMFEPYYNGTVVPNTWQTWDAAHGKFWSNNTLTYNGLGGVNAGSYASNFALSDVLHDHPNAKLVGVVSSLGTWNPASQILFDNLKINNDTYNFDPGTPPNGAKESDQIVTQPDLALPFGWYYYNDNTDTPSLTDSPAMSIAANPKPKAHDNGAVMLDGSYGLRSDIATAQYIGTPLTGIAKLGFSTYQNATAESDFLAFDVNLNYSGLNGYQGRLVYVPSVNGTLKANKWQPWEAVNKSGDGLWTWSHYYTNGNKWPDGNTSEYRTWDDIINSFPGANISGQLVVRAGNPDNHAFVGYTDHIYLSTAASNVNYNFELASPSVPTGGQPNAGYKTTNVFNYTWNPSTDPYGLPITYEYQASQNPHTTNGILDTNVWNNVTDHVNSSQYPLTQPMIPSVGTSDGTWYWQVRACDSAYNCSAWSQVWNYTLDSHAPATPGVAMFDANGKAITNGYINTQDFTFKLANNPGDGVTRYQLMYWNSIPGSAFNGENNAWSPTDLAAAGHMSTLGTYTDNFTQGEGTHYFTFSACDAAGNCSPFSTPFTVTFDNTAPTGLANLSPANGSFTTTTKLTQISWQAATDPSTPITYYYESSNSSATNPDGSFTSPVYQSGALTTAYISTPGTPEGVYYWHVKACDAAGNCTAWTSPWKVTVDNISLTAPTLLAPTDGQVINGTSLTNSWSSVANAVTYEYQSFDANNPNGSVRFDHNYATISKTATNVTDGTVFYWRVRAIDQYGQPGPWSNNGNLWKVTVDNIPPSTPTANPGAGTYTGTQLVSLTSTDNSGTSPTIYYTTDGTTPSNTNGTLYTGAFTVSSNETVQAIAYDAADNPSGVLSANYTINPVKPLLFTPHVLGANTSNPQGQGSNNQGNNGHVLGDSTTTPSTSTTDTNGSGDTGQVKGDSTTNTNNNSNGTKHSSNFLGLGWWWLLILAVLAAFFTVVFRRSGSNEQA